MTEHYLGLDAGGSKTVALLSDGAGRVLGRGRGASGDVYSAPDADDQVVATLVAALADAGVLAGDVRHAALRLAGVDWPEDEAHWRAVVSARLPALASVSVKNDGLSLLRCAGPSGVGVAITAGTGPAVAARGPSGAEYCACWWIQHPLGGHALGRAAFTAVVDAELSIGPPTALRDELLALHGYGDVGAMLHDFTGREPSRAVPDARVAARSVLRCASGGDAVALAIVEQQATTFARLASVAVHRTGQDVQRETRCVIGGSLSTSEHPAFRDALTRALREEVGAIDVVAATAPPVAGALLDALVEGGVVVDDRCHQRVLAATHPADFLLS